MKLLLSRSLADLETGSVFMMEPVCGFCGEEVEMMEFSVTNYFAYDFGNVYIHISDNTPICEAQVKLGDTLRGSNALC